MVKLLGFKLKQQPVKLPEPEVQPVNDKVIIEVSLPTFEPKLEKDIILNPLRD